MSKFITVRVSFKNDNKMYDIFKEELKYGLRSRFIENILSKISTDDEKLLRKRIFSIITKDFSVSFPGLNPEKSREKGSIDDFESMKGKFMTKGGGSVKEE